MSTSTAIAAIMPVTLARAVAGPTGLSGRADTTMPHDLPPDERDPPNALPRGTLLNDKFRVMRVIGVGGFGIVYLAHDEMSDVDVAIKEYMPASLAGRTKTMQVSLTSQSNAETFALGLKSFWNEARLLAKFRDEHLPLLKVYDAFQANGTAYMVMPVLRGRTAYQLRLEMQQPPSERWLRALLNDLLPALERLHAEQVYHRDISPDNIQIDANGKPVLMDLGAARHVISNRTQSITAILKPGYAPIEQYGESDKLRQGPWTDIYALGATLHFLLLNKSPSAATARIFDTGTPLVAHDLPGCSPAFLRVIDWMLEPRPESRPQNVEQLRTALFDSDDATVVMPSKRATPPAAARADSPTARPPSPLPSTMAPTRVMTPAPSMPAPMAPAQAAPNVQPPPKRELPAPTIAVSATAPPTAAATQPGNGRSPMPMVLAGVAALVVAGAAAAWLWPTQKPPGTPVARPGAASAPEVSKAAPNIEPRPEPTNQPTTATAAPPTSLPAVAIEPAPVPAPTTAPTTTTKLAPAAPPAVNAAAPATLKPDKPPTQTAAAIPSKAAPASGATPSPGKKAGPVNDKDGALLPKPAEPAPVAAAAPALPPSPAPLPAPAPVAVSPAAESTAPSVASPSERCSDKDGFARTLCVSVVCGLPALHKHPECVAIRRR